MDQATVPSGRRIRRVAFSATAAASVGVLPPFLVGAAGVLFRHELGIEKAQLGVVVASFFAAAAVASAVLGRWTEKLGPHHALVLGAAITGTGLLAVAAFARSYAGLLSLVALTGVGNGIVQPAANLALARGVPVRQGFAFGVKQSGIPLATMVAGVTVPLIGATLGWRWAFVAGAVLAAAVAVCVPPDGLPATGTRTAREAGTGQGLLHLPLLALAVAACLGFAASTAFGAFLVESAVASGLTVAQAGGFLAAGSVAGIVSRLVVGWLADRARGRYLGAVASMQILGATGYAALVVEGSWAFLVVGVAIGYVFGWGWVGLLVFAVVRLYPASPAVSTGLLQAGAATGSALGPLAFGLVADRQGFGDAWALCALAALGAAALTVVARRQLSRIGS